MTPLTPAFPSCRKVCRFATAVLASALASAFWACDSSTDSGPAPTLKIVSPTNGGTVSGPSVLLQVKTTGFSFAAAKIAAAQRVDSVPDGHIHVYLDKPATTDADAVTVLTRTDTTTLNITTAGWHYIIVQGASASHDDIPGMIDSVKFMVTLP